jgi:simple sugar transport system permease protein
MALTGAVAACMIAPPEGSPFRHADGTAIFSPDLNLLWILLGGLSVALFCGLWNGVLVAWFRLQPIVATLILMVAGRGVAQLVTNGQIPTFEHAGFNSIGGGFLFMLPTPVVIGIIAVIVMTLVIRGSALGLFVEAVGNNNVAARIAGVNAVGVKIACYTISGLLAGVAGFIVTSDIKAADVNNAGMYLELDAILATAIGGTSLAGGRFSLIGSVLGALVIQTLTTTIISLPNVPPEIAMVAKAIIVIVLCLIQSRKFRGKVLGLFGVRRPA